MRTLSHLSLTASLLVLAAVTHKAVLAQPHQQVAPEPGTRARAPQAGTLALERAYKLSRTEALRQSDLVKSSEAEAFKIAEAFPNNFLASMVDHGTNFRIMLVFDRDVSLADVQRLVEPELRPHLSIKRSRRSADEIANIHESVLRLLTELKAAGSVAYNFRNDKIEIGLEDNLDEAAFLSRLPQELRGDVIVQRKAPALNNADYPTGYTGNTYVWGGWPLHDGNLRPSCTAGFVFYNTSTGATSLSTAGHCGSYMRVWYKTTDNSYRDLTIPFLDKFAETSNGRSYDYQLHALNPGQSSGYIWVDGSVTGGYRHSCSLQATNCVPATYANVHPYLPNNGTYLKISGAVRGGSANYTNPTHPIGAIRCKHGHTTGVSCGPITNSSMSTSMKVNPLDANPTAFYAVIEVVPTDYMVASYSGDSGGPVFTEPGYDSASGYYTTSAAGTIIGGVNKNDGTQGGTRPCIIGSPVAGKYDTGCNLIYMPVDRINDHQTSWAIYTHNQSYVTLN